MMLAMIACVDSDDHGNDLKMIFQFNWQLQADPNHPLLIWKRVPGQRLWRHSEQANGSKGGDASQDLRPLRLQELEEGACHCGQTEAPHHCLFGRKRSSMSTTFTDAWSSTSSLGGNFGDVIGSERIEHFKLQDEMSRWLFNFHYHLRHIILLKCENLRNNFETTELHHWRYKYKCSQTKKMAPGQKI